DRSRWPADRPSFTITAVERLAVESLAVRYECPPYTGIEPRTIGDFDGRIEAPVGSTAHLTLTLNQPAPVVRLDVDGGAPTAMHRSDDGRTFTAALPVRSDGRYRLLVVDTAGRTLQRLPDGAPGEPGYDATDEWFPIVAVPDAPPKITFLSPGRDVSASLDSPLPTRVQASDDYGLSSAQLYAARQGEPFKAVHDYPVADKRGGRFSHELALAAVGTLQDGDVIEYYAEATDARLLPGAGPQISRTRQFRVKGEFRP
ncbi:unnamed protein product, partial [marine sediment metagenome]